MNYLQWNDQLVENFFRSDMAGSEVFLYVGEGLINSLGSSAGDDLVDFIASIRQGPPGTTRSGICQKALQSMQNWRASSREYPPYVGYLALFALAAGLAGAFAPHAYYPRLRTLLGETPAAGQYPSFDKMYLLWDDLEQWANVDKDGSLGVFNARIAGNMFHVGLPIAQLLLSQEERRVLPLIFARSGLDPTSPTSEAELGVFVALHGSGLLRKQTLDLLNSTASGDSDTRAAIIEAIDDSLRNWDGELNYVPTGGGYERVYASLRLCCSLDAVARAVSVTYRCKTNHEYPDHNLKLVNSQDKELFECGEYSRGWSIPIRHSATSNLATNGTFDWESGASLIDQDAKWKVCLPPSKIRILVSGESEVLPGLIEVRRMAYGVPFYLLTKGVDSELETWGKQHCEAFENLRIVSGLPPGWVMYRASSASSDQGVKDRYPSLAFPTAVQIAFEGGLRLDRRAWFFDFAPPRVVLRGPMQDLRLFCNDIELKSGDDPTNFALPGDAPSNVRLCIEVRRNGEIIKRASLVLIGDLRWKDCPDLAWTDEFGDCMQNGKANRASGALVKEATPTELELFESPYWASEKPITLVGRCPGQVVKWKNSNTLPEWPQIWAITAGRYKEVHYCGENLAEAGPIAGMSADERSIRRWKNLIYHRRKRIRPPAHPALRALWSHYVEVAKNV